MSKLTKFQAEQHFFCQSHAKWQKQVSLSLSLNQKCSNELQKQCLVKFSQNRQTLKKKHCFLPKSCNMSKKVSLKMLQVAKLSTNTAKHNPLVVRLYGIQWVLNVAWNPVFFYFQKVDIGLLVIVGLLLSVLLIAIKFSRIQKSWTLAIIPYVLWLLVATSLNAYIFFKI
jgi:hypothetical protein